MIGDCAQNLHAALDHAIFQIAPLSVRLTHADYISFPIFDHANGYGKWKRKRERAEWIRAVDGKAMTVIDKLQPCDGGNPQPRAHALWTLYRLSNIDKHRSLHVAVPAIASMTIPEGAVITEEPETHTVVVATPAPVEGMDMRFNMTVHIVFAEGEDITGLPVLPSLFAIGTTVAKAINRLRPFMV